jgi:hypothetical protein
MVTGCVPFAFVGSMFIQQAHWGLLSLGSIYIGRFQASGPAKDNAYMPITVANLVSSQLDVPTRQALDANLTVPA